MTDPLSLTASLIAVVQISHSVLLFCYQIRGQINDAHDEISRIITDVEALGAILDKLEGILPFSAAPSGASASLLDNWFLADGSSATGLSVSQACISAMKSCETVLTELREKLKPLARPGLKSKLIWPFESSNIQRKLDIIVKQKGTLQLILSACNTRMLNEQSHRFDEQQRDSKRTDILTWYKTSDPEQNHRLSRSKHEPDTAKWIFDVEDFRNWKDKPGESLWIQGIPGAGKTILCSTIIDYMSHNYGGDPSNRIVYFYFDFGDSGKQTVVSLLKSVIYQLISAVTVMPDSAANLYTKRNGLEQPSVDELVEVITIEISRTSRTFLMIDALDECPTEERRLFFETFVQGSLPSNLNLLITSRKEPDIDAVLSPSFSRTICIENAVIDADVKVYVGNAIVRDAKLWRWKPAMREEILNAVVEGSHGMFQWAVCQLDIVKECVSPAMLHIELMRMPKTIEQTYDRILQNVTSRHRPFVQSALHWLAFAKRPLLLQEIAEAAVLQPRSENFDLDLFRLLDENLILELCGTLVTVSTVEFRVHISDDWLSEKLWIHGGFYSSHMNNNKFKVVSLSHYSVKEYIASQRLEKGALSNFYASEKLANTYLAECCLFYLLHFNRGEIAVELDFMESPLLEYAACNWISHWNQASTSGQSELRHLAESFFDSKSSKAYVNWLNIWNPDTKLESTSRDFMYRRDIKKSVESLPPMLYWVASLGDLALLQSLIENGAEISKRGGKFEYPLGAAVYHGHSDVVRYLLQQGADPNFLSRDFGNVLQIAALGGSVDVMKQLIDAGAAVNAQGGSYNTPVIAAASRDNFEAVALLLNSGADLKVGSPSHGSSLYQAAAAGNTYMVTALLAAGADLNGIGDSEGTPLYAAAESGSLSLVRLLLRRGADVNKGSSSVLCGFPVTIAARKGHSQVVRVLTRGGADVNLSTGHRRVSTLEASIEGRDMSTFLAILDAGADLNVTGNMYVNCFHAAISTGEREMAKILLERGAETEEEGFLEAVRRHEENPWFLEKLLQMNPNCNVWTDSDGSALHVAIKQDDGEAAWTILNHDPFVDTVSKDGTPLGVAIKMGMIDLARELIRRGADVNRRGKGDSPFNLAINHACNERKGDLTLADMLLEHGADCNLGTREWVFGICKENQEGVLRYLVGKGVDLDLIAPRVNCTPLQYAAKEGNRRTIDLLLELGADINGPEGENGYTIHYALMSGNESIVRYFLDKGAAIHDSGIDCGSIRRAIVHELTDLIPLLLEKGALLNSPSQRRSTAAEAFEHAPKEIFKMLMDQGAVFSDDFSTLERTIKKRQLNELKELLECGLDPNVSNDWKQAVTVAVDSGAKDAVDLLIEYGADLNQIPQDTKFVVTGRQGPLVKACANGDLDMTHFLLERGADPNIDNKDYGCPLACAVDDASNLQLVELLLHHGANIDVKLEIFSRAVFGGEKVISRLLEEPMTTGDRERYLDQALQSAAYWAILEMCSWLLDEGANPNYHGGRWGSPLAAAIAANHNIYQSAVRNNRRLIINLLLRHGADVNQSTVYTSPERDPNVNGDTITTPLLLALENGPTSTAQMILEAGADPNMAGGEMHLPLETAARCRWAMVEPLLAAGAEVNAVGGPKYGSALHAAAYAQNANTIKLLLAHSADATITAGKYGSVLQAAAKSEPISSGGLPGRDSVPAMKLLMAAGADVHARCGKYGSALQMAAKSGNLRAVRWLVEEMGVDVNVKGGRFGSVRAAAVMKGRWAVLSYLESKYGKFKWGGETNKDDKWIGWITE